MNVRARVALVGAATIGLTAAGASAAHAAPGITITGWDTSTCASEGAPSPQIRWELAEAQDPSEQPTTVKYQLGIDDQADYEPWIDFGFGETVVTFTGEPVRPGEHVLTQGVAGQAPPLAEALTFTAPACPDGSPAPAATAWSQQAEGAGELTATFGEPTCSSPVVPGRSALPFDYTVSDSGDAQIVVLVDGEETIGTTLTAGSEDTYAVAMPEGEHEYVLQDGAGNELDTATATAISCSSDGDEDATGEDDGADGSSDDGAGDGTSAATDDGSEGGQGSASTEGADAADGASGDGAGTADDGSAATGATDDAGADTPAVPVVVQTDSPAPGVGAWPALAASSLVLLGLGLLVRRLWARDRLG